MDTVTLDNFAKFEGLRRAGITNMLDVSVVSAITELSPDKQKKIRVHYDSLRTKYAEDKTANKKIKEYRKKYLLHGKGE